MNPRIVTDCGADKKCPSCITMPSDRYILYATEKGNHIQFRPYASAYLSQLDPYGRSKLTIDDYTRNDYRPQASILLDDNCREYSREYANANKELEYRRPNTNSISSNFLGFDFVYYGEDYVAAETIKYTNADSFPIKVPKPDYGMFCDCGEYVIVISDGHYIISNKSHEILCVLKDEEYSLQAGDCYSRGFFVNKNSFMVENEGDVYSVVYILWGSKASE